MKALILIIVVISGVGALVKFYQAYEISLILNSELGSYVTIVDGFREIYTSMINKCILLGMLGLVIATIGIVYLKKPEILEKLINKITK
jgi:hypothetical protein